MYVTESCVLTLASMRPFFADFFCSELIFKQHCVLIYAIVTISIVLGKVLSEHQSSIKNSQNDCAVLRSFKSGILLIIHNTYYKKNNQKNKSNKELKSQYRSNKYVDN